MNSVESFDATKIERPDAKLFSYYVWCALLTGPLTPLVLLPLWFRYTTLKYKFDDDGVSMSWGVFFRREVYLTYRRIQDIHLTRNLLQRWMGLANISVQTASGNAQAEMTIEGVLEADQLRDFLYGRMRGARDGTAPEKPSEPPVMARPSQLSSGGSEQAVASGDEVALQLLTEIRDSLKSIANRGGGES